MQRGLILRIKPAPNVSDHYDKIREILREENFTPNERVEREKTSIVDITLGPESVRSNLKQKWRNCLNASEKAGLTIARRSDVNAFDEFHSLYDFIVESKAFHSNLDSGFYSKVHTWCHEYDGFRVTYAYRDGVPVAGHVGHIAGSTGVYILGASNAIGRKFKAGYLLQWDFILQCTEFGCEWYDLGGIDESGNPGVFEFKKGINGQEYCTPGFYEFTPKKPLPRILSKALQWKRR